MIQPTVISNSVAGGDEIDPDEDLKPIEPVMENVKEEEEPERSKVLTR